jgi:hypothetical protein
MEPKKIFDMTDPFVIDTEMCKEAWLNHVKSEDPATPEKYWLQLQ